MRSWDDLRFVHAVAERGSLAGAARALRVDATTVGRRIASLEEELGTPIFVRSVSGWRPTERGAAVVAAAARAAEAARDVTRGAAEDGPRGVVRVTTIESVASWWLAPRLPAILEHWPDISLHVVCTDRTLDLAAGEADVAIRVGRPTTGDLVARRLVTVRERVYASPAWLQAHGVAAEEVTTLEGVPVVHVGGRPTDPLDACGRYRPVFRSNSVNAAAAAVHAGVGVGLLPNLVARGLGLVPLPSLPSLEELPLWLVSHRDLLRVARVRAIYDALGDET
jgi:DNA-binding transcriptional LysR family regulator